MILVIFQNGDVKNRPPLLSHHLSLPKTLPEMSNMEKFLQFQDSVPLRIRAKRGCATHPRSIAERVRTEFSFEIGIENLINFSYLII